MLTKRLVILGAFAILPAFAQWSSALRYNGPVQGRVEHGDGSVTSTNWSGYAVTGTGFTKAIGSWIVPALTCTSGTEYAVFWVGIDGYNDGTVEQAGTEGVCSGTNASYSAWYEFYPATPILTISGITVKPGDLMESSISYNTTTSQFTVAIKDVTTGKAFQKSSAVAGAGRTSAEFIAEAPSSFSVLPLADYGTVLFGKDNTALPGCTAQDTTTHGVIGAFPANDIEAITMEKNNIMESIPSSLSSDGSSFSVAWAAK
jgi:hypothetical protein